MTCPISKTDRMLGLLFQIVEAFAQMGKSMVDSVGRMKNFDINLKAKRSKAKVRNDDEVLTAVILREIIF